MSAFPIEFSLPDRVRRVLVVGGSFDPPHRAHVRLAQDAARASGCDHLLFIPARQSPLKDTEPTAAAHRLAMLRLALADSSNASICTFELDRPGPSYTVDTLRALHAALPESVELRLFVGSDQLQNFDAWREPDELVSLAPPVVVLRPPDTKSSLRAAGVPATRIAWIVDVPVDTVSSTEVRGRLRRGDDVRDLLAPRVRDYIEQHRLYGTGR